MIDFTDKDEGGTLDQRAFNWLLGNGVTIDAIAMPWAVRSARVTFEPTGGYRPCPGLGNYAYILPVFDDGMVDLVAWSPKDDRLATRLGYGGALGQGNSASMVLGLPIALCWCGVGRSIGSVPVDAVSSSPILQPPRISSPAPFSMRKTRRTPLRCRTLFASRLRR